jgi:uncharacterized cofD-like protein
VNPASAKLPSPVVRLGCTPERPAALPSALDAIAHADLILLGPGSLYTSLLPNLLVPELVTAISRCQAPRLYICNLMTQPGETEGLDVGGHLRAIEAQLASLGVTERLFDSVLAQNSFSHTNRTELFTQGGARPVVCDREALIAQGYKVMLANLQGPQPGAALRHDPRSVAQAVMRFYRKKKND